MKLTRQQFLLVLLVPFGVKVRTPRKMYFHESFYCRPNRNEITLVNTQGFCPGDECIVVADSGGREMERLVVTAIRDGEVEVTRV